MKTIYDFSVKDSKLNEVSLTKFKDKVLLIVNVASYCGLTYQYEGIENLYKKYKKSGFEVLAFPCNQFALQEPGTNEEIRNFCDTKYAITFEIFNKIHVNGSKSDPLNKFFLLQVLLIDLSLSSTKYYQHQISDDLFQQQC